MVISILGGFMKGYNEDKALEKKIEANALALGQQSIIERNAALSKRAADMEDFEEKEKFKAGLKPKKSFDVEFDDGTSVSFPTRENFGNDTKLSVGLIDNVIAQLDTEEKIAEFEAEAQSSGMYGSNVMDYLKSYRLNASQKWGPDNKGEPINVNVSVSDDHPNNDFFNQVRTRIRGFNIDHVMDQTVKPIRVTPTADSLYNIERPNQNTQGDISADNTYLYNNAQIINPNSPVLSMEDADGKHYFDNKIGVPLNSFLQASANDLFNRNFANEKDLPFIYRDWDNFFFTPAVQDNPTTEVNEGQGIGLDVYVLEEDGKAKLQTVYVNDGWNHQAWTQNVYAAMNKNVFRRGEFRLLNDSEFNNAKDNIYNDLSAIQDAQDAAEDSIFLALDIFNGVELTGVDPMSLAGNFVKTINDSLIAPNSQFRQLFNVFNSLVTDSIDAEWNGLDDERKKEIRAANKGLQDYLSADEEARNKMFEDTARARTLLDQIFTLLAYNVALTTQGGTSLSARVSNEDYDNSKQAVVGGGFDTLENRMLGLMQYYSGTINKSMSFYLLDNENGYNIQPKRRTLTTGLIPTILGRELFPTPISQPGNYKSPYSAINYLMIRPNGRSKSQTWAKSIQRAYRGRLDKVFDGDFDPNANTSVLTP